MPWSGSAIFRPFIADVLDNTTAFDLTADTVKIALYDNDITPDRNVSAANSAYNAGQWVSTGNEVFDAAEWTVGGVALASKVLDVATTNVVMYDAADVVSGSSATLANVHGGLIYSDTLTAPVADQGICYLYFGGANSVTDGTLTVAFNAQGIFRITV